MKSPLLSINNIDVFYGEIQALRSVTLEVHTGQIVALLGSNGAGKTTTLKTISGLLHPTTGTVTLDGVDISRNNAYKIAQLGVVHVPEGRHILKGMTVNENLELGAFRLSDRRERIRRITQIHELFPVLGERRNQDASLLSGGEQQMLAIGRGLMANPTVMLLDEPSMGLAPILVKEIMKIVKQLNESGITILLVEQNARLALGLAHYGYVLENGIVRTEGNANTLSDRDEVIQAYLGTTIE